MDRQNKYLRFIWKCILVAVGAFSIIHFAKDITQDILKTPTFLDLLGNIQEDTSKFSFLIQNIYYGLWIFATILQPALVYFIFKTWKKDRFNKYDLYIISSIAFFLIMTFWAYTLS